ncbi:MAG: hypothetical protein II840_09340 [Kiritimatiellae bacterium]|nr:hypothetical protein [Kiritimatiellia bacterium]
MKKPILNRTKRTEWGMAAALLMAGALAIPASARTVYDAGKALRQNCESGSYANPYTDANGGVWSYHTASGVAPFTGLSDFPTHSKMESNTMDGWICLSNDNPTHPLLLVNTTGEAVSSYCSSGNQLEADELMFHPSAYGYAVLRFTVPEDGWYSAFASFRDVDQGDSGGLSGVDVHVTLGSESADDTDLATTHVTLEDYAGWNAASKRTKRFDYQMPVRYLTQGMRIQFAVGPNVLADWGHASDGTGVKVLVVKEDEGQFYDAGAAFAANIAGDYVNPYGSAAHGTWHALLSNLSVSIAEMDFPSWVSQNLEYSFDHDLTAQLSLGTPVADTVRGFNRPAGGPPYVTANVSSIVSGNTSPGELRVLPAGNAGQCTVVRFRPPEAGRYSGSVVIRDIGDIEHDYDDGVEVFLVVADQVVTSAVVRAEIHEVMTARLTFDSTLLAVGEPVDIIVSPRSANNANDETALSVIFRREDGDVYDANKSFYAHHNAGNTSVPFNDVLGGGAQWSLGSMEGSWLPDSFVAFAGYLTRYDSVPNLFWWEHAYANDGTLPRIAMSTNAIASVGNDIYLTPYPRLAIAPNEFCAHPAPAGQNNSCAAVRAIVPSNGIYHVRGRARDLDNVGSYDGVRFTLAASGYIADTREVVLNSVRGEGSNAEATLDGERLWLKEGETVDAVVDPMGNYAADTTGLGVCYEREGDGTASVVNVDFTGTGSGKLSANTARGREGFGDQHAWNALRPGGAASATVDGCRDADGTTLRKMTVTLMRNSGEAIWTGANATGTTLLDAYVASYGTEDTYTFTISNLRKNEPYTLWLYSANGTTAGNAVFTVGGVTKGVEGRWLQGTKMMTRFDVVSDANGEISGTFAAADSNGGAFNGLTLVGDVRRLSGLMVILR